jgi:hypothetical protein
MWRRFWYKVKITDLKACIEDEPCKGIQYIGRHQGSKAINEARLICRLGGDEYGACSDLKRCKSICSNNSIINRAIGRIEKLINKLG